MIFQFWFIFQLFIFFPLYVIGGHGNWILQLIQIKLKKALWKKDNKKLRRELVEFVLYTNRLPLNIIVKALKRPEKYCLTRELNAVFGYPILILINFFLCRSRQAPADDVRISGFNYLIKFIRLQQASWMNYLFNFDTFS